MNFRGMNINGSTWETKSMRTLKKGLSCLLVLNLLLGGGLVFAPKADALSSILFPFITTEASKFTFITIENDGAAPAPGAAGLHFTYAMKAVPIVNKAGCEHFDGDVDTTPTDMMIFEANRKVVDASGTTALFEGGTTAPITSAPLAFPVADRVGFLIVEQNIATGLGGAYLAGTAAVIDSGTGLTFSYSTQFTTAAISPNPDFSAIDGGVYGGGAPVGPTGVGFSGFKAATWYPTTAVATSWFVLPLSTRLIMAPSGGGGIRLGLRTATDHLPTPNLQGAYDLDEHFFSGGKSTTIRCFGVVTRGDLLQGAVDAATAGGGFTFVVSNGATTTLAATDAVDPGGVYNPTPFTLIKLQSTSVLGSPKATEHAEPDHNPCFNPSGVFAGNCAGY